MMSFAFAVLALAALSGFARGESCYCTEQYDPVCASNGQVFSNLCMLRCHNFNNHDNLQVAAEGDRCSHQQTLAALPHIGKLNCFRLCPHIYVPVCGSDGVTYGSSCALNCVKKIRNEKQGLVEVHRGRCDAKPQAFEQLVKQGQAESDVCLCTDEFKPVCGNNLHTYANMCAFQCEAKKNLSLKVMYQGRCIIMP